jgi:hypothetical protein
LVEHIGQLCANDALGVLLLLLHIMKIMLQAFAPFVDFLEQSAFAFSSGVFVLQKMAVLHLLFKTSYLQKEFFFIYVFSLLVICFLQILNMACLIFELIEKVFRCFDVVIDLLFKVCYLLVIFILLFRFVFLEIKPKGCHFLAQLLQLASIWAGWLHFFCL